MDCRVKPGNDARILLDQRHRGGGHANFALVDVGDKVCEYFRIYFNILREDMALFLLCGILQRVAGDETAKN
jgi:hypothetical protein